MRDFLQRRRQNRQIREAIDTYPGGICFAYPGGMTILVNPTMNRLCHELTGQTILNAEVTWERLQTSEGNRVSDRELCFQMENRTVWQFRREELMVEKQRMYQYTAEDVTELFEYWQRLQEAILRRRDYQERQRRLMKDIARTNEEKERLQAKIRIHDDFGRCLIATKKYLQGEMMQDGQKLYEEWDYVIQGMNHLSDTRGSRQLPAPEEELLRVAELIGCRVIFQGKQPSERRPLLLMYAAIREALTNAVRHGGADCLTVQVEDDSKGYKVRISDNGTGEGDEICEGGGLRNLRDRLEQDGARMDILTDRGVILQLWLPKGE